ncbi:MAG: hypothetical protein ABJF23_32720 [Bryobacteraceae bacterium]
MISSISSKTIPYRCAIALVSLSLAAVQLPAQERNFRSTTFYKIDPGRIGDFQAAVKEYNAVLSKAHYDHPYSLWVAATGDHEYVLVSYHAKLAELDVLRRDDPKLKDYQADLARIASRINHCALGVHSAVGEINKDLTLPAAKDMPKMVSVLRITLHPDKVNEYLALAKSELLPAVKKSGVKTYATVQMRYGAPRSEIVSSLGVDSWADLDGTSPVAKAMGAESYQKYLDKIRPLMTSAEYNVYRYQPELSYRPDMPAGAPTSGSR